MTAPTEPPTVSTSAPSAAPSSAAAATRTVVIIGSGFGGQCAAINLLRRGITDFVILERRDFLGGTWCQNSYPGAAVDVQSPLYSIASEPYAWSRVFATQEELETYTRHVLDKHDLPARTVTGAEVTGLTWTGAAWEIRTAAAGTFHGRFVVNATGPPSTPVVPPFPFLVTGPNTGIGHTSAIFVIEAQMEYVMRAIERVRAAGATSVEVTAAAERTYTTMIHRAMERTVWKTGGCTSWYQSQSGHVVAMFPGFSFTFRQLAKRFRAEHHVVAA